jgi:hypothetical protein
MAALERETRSLDQFLRKPLAGGASDLHLEGREQRPYPITSSAVKTAARVVSEIPGLPFSTRLTVASLTPACLATSASLPAIVQLHDKTLQVRRIRGATHRSGKVLAASVRLG